LKKIAYLATRLRFLVKGKAKAASFKVKAKNFGLKAKAKA